MCVFHWCNENMIRRLFLLSSLLLIGCSALPACGDTSTCPPGVSLVLSLPSGRVQFHRSEVIPLTATFLSSSPRQYKLNTDDGSRDRPWNTDTFLVEPSFSAMDPLCAYYAHEFGEAYSGGGPRFQPLTLQPIAIPFTLNEWLRFDAPGHYRVYLSSRRVVDTDKLQSHNLIFQGRTTISNAVDLEIIPNNPAWNVRTLRQALPLFNTNGFGYQNQTAKIEAVRAVRFLGTTEAVLAMVARYASFDENNSWNTPTYTQTRLGLFGFAHPGAVIQEMKRRLADPDFPVFSVLLDDLAQTQYLAAYPQPVPQLVVYDALADRERSAAIHLRLVVLNALKEQDRKLLVAALPAKRGKARAISSYALLMADYAALDKDVHRKLLQALVPVFDDLTIQEKNALLDNAEWARASGACILPLLRHAYASPSQMAEPGTASDYDQKQTYSLALRRLRELSPDEGRTLLLAQIASPHPRIDSDTLLSLPDLLLPVLDTALASNLENGIERRGDDWELYARLVERYATKAILPRMKAAYVDKRGEWAGPPQFSMLAYFLRTDRTYGIQHCRIALDSRKTSFWYQSLLSDVATRYPCLELKALADEYLKDPDPQVAADAAKAAQMK